MNDSHAPIETGRATLSTATPRRVDAGPAPVKLSVRGLDFHYGKFHAIKGVNMEIPEKRVTALIAPSATQLPISCIRSVPGSWLRTHIARVSA